MNKTNMTMSVVLVTLLLGGMHSASAAERQTASSEPQEPPQSSQQRIEPRAQEFGGGMNRDIIRRHKPEQPAAGKDVKPGNTTGGCCLLPAVQK